MRALRFVTLVVVGAILLAVFALGPGALESARALASKDGAALPLALGAALCVAFVGFGVAMIRAQDRDERD